MSYKVDEVAQWIEHDPDKKTAQEVSDLLEKAEAGDTLSQAELTDRFSGTLEFGTAGLRGEMAGGPNRMNRAVVRRAAYGLTAWLKEKVGPDALVVIGYDARYNSADFAADTAAIVTAAGLRAKIMPRALPTPVLAFSVRYFGADAGVMVTASHNPAKDNGYKVYTGSRATDEAGRGAQIVPPTDSQIAEKIAQAPLADEISLAESGWDIISEDVIDTYVETAIKTIPATTPRDLKIVYTAMHGVGAETMRRVLSGAGFTNVVEVPEQNTPDPDFPTVAFPNPEEAGALDLAIAHAKHTNADIVIASDPDADRASAAIPINGVWTQLSGDEIGSILGEQVASRLEASGELATLANSIVSSQLLEQIARVHGQDYEATLTGFKWISRAHNISFGYEEAIGFCVDPQSVKDKDGLSAGLLIAQTAARLKAEGKNLRDELNRIAVNVGALYATAPVTIRVDDLSIIPATMDKVRNNPPTVLIGSEVSSVVDLSIGTSDLPPTNAMILRTTAGDRAIVRPSGTEPKVKCYLEVVVPLEGMNIDDARQHASKRLEQFKADMGQALSLD
ncbi:phospho-sugar mutase [Arcanobacterium phocisimile]|uniref:Phospho-sugar mutase n=1 Tax=Arcanobacterium phocisimile TaxID=1302235 RepID=A0ABX7IF07_9ACTO|nr:phospho-sugar mutase [Arcanobacterium phocisimile]QRV01721.1 phospho-sugar mutase [Arcanobacterium phocisimile]